jgi:hypothetical protein
VVLVRLYQVEVLAFTFREAIVAVELDLGSYYRVLTGFTLHVHEVVTFIDSGAVEPVRVVERLETLVVIHAASAGVAGNEGVTLDNPHEFLYRVVEVELDLVGRRSHGFTTSELELFNEVFVADLGKTTTFISIEVDVVDVEGSRHEARSSYAVTHIAASVPAEVTELVEFEPYLHFVVLESNERESKTRVAAEPELERHVESVFRSTLAVKFRSSDRFSVGHAIRIATNFGILGERAYEFRHVTYHFFVTSLLAGFLAEFIPDVEPVTVVLVDLLTTDFNIHVVDEVVADVVQPTEFSARSISVIDGHLREGGLEVDTVDQVTITGDGALYLLTEVGGAVEGLFNGFHSKVGVTTVHHLEEGNLRITS